ncbi:hypothetical protein K435DRAFT_973165 [Dendrothele bispora CBS 962.96]|uniref:Uncharacterized protein n=1 Tax=Dendrothele bispora (strain CBS 962.96) TaxID=1314807 RepID=A0A4S8KUH3_DENBC|nr:hypothetical protein K435DRAFT_973165 [Dendrothele bispora CBS 962.96]
MNGNGLNGINGVNRVDRVHGGGKDGKMQEVLELNRKVKIVLVKMEEDLGKYGALVIPRGELRTIALPARLSGLIDPLKEFIKTKTVWGTCAREIL